MTGRWVNGTFVRRFSVVGTVMKGASGDWFACGCLADWEDTHLGSFESESEARKRVEQWVLEQDDDD